MASGYPTAYRRGSRGFRPTTPTESPTIPNWWEQPNIAPKRRAPRRDHRRYYIEPLKKYSPEWFREKLREEQRVDRALSGGRNFGRLPPGVLGGLSAAGRRMMRAFGYGPAGIAREAAVTLLQMLSQNDAGYYIGSTAITFFASGGVNLGPATNWTHSCSYSPVDPEMYRWGLGSAPPSPNPCANVVGGFPGPIFNQVPTGFFSGADISLPSNGAWNWLYFGPEAGPPAPPGTRMHLRQRIWISAAQAGKTLVWNPARTITGFTYPPELPYFPQLDPDTAPIGHPAPQPARLPYRMLPHVKPDVKNRVMHAQRGPHSPVRPRLDKPVVGPGVVIVPPVRPPPDPPDPPTPPRPRPPPPRTKEGKFGASAGGRALAWAARGLSAGENVLTEAKDFVNALWKALPTSSKRKYGGSLKGKLNALYNDFDKIDWGKAFGNLVANEIEDRTIGRAIGKGGRQARRVGITYGGSLGAHGSATRNEVLRGLGL